MSRKTNRLVVTMLTVVLLCSCFMLLWENSKTIENLPSLDAVLQMDENKVDSKVSGYMEHQIIEVWGKPDRSDTETLVWILPEGSVTVRADTMGKIVFCGRKRMEDLPVLRELAHMNEQEMHTWVLGQAADHLTSKWHRPNRIDRQLFTWRLPVHSDHQEVTVEVDQWGIIENARFND